MSRIISLALVFGSLTGLSAHEANPVPRVTSSLDIAYVKGGASRQKLDVFRPEGQERRPVLLLIHGGSWMIGDKNFFGLYRDVAESFARQGYVVVAANYRLTPWVRHPEHARDVARAFAWTRRNIKDHGGDPDAIFLLGHSAGGHLVSLVATDESFLREPDLKLTDADRKALRGVISVSGVYRIPRSEELSKLVEGMMAGLGPKSTPVSPGAFSLMSKTGVMLNPFPLVFGSDPREHLKASPLHHVRPGLVPFLVLYAEAELPLLPEMARDFGEALKKARNEVDVERVESRNHNSLFFRLDEPTDPARKKVLSFLQRHR